MATAITLDGNTYAIFEKQYDRVQGKIASTRRTITGDLDRVESGVFETHYRMTLRCTLTDVANLRTSYAKVATTGTPPTNRLNFVDLEGFNWNPASGSNDATHAYSTGVYFDSLGAPRLAATRGWDSNNRFLVEVELVAIAKGLAS